ncbi:hypothetical protein [Streptomyces kronopolitis]|nr:hypothetical protein [Streptomyces kronopolitis]
MARYLAQLEHAIRNDLLCHHVKLDASVVSTDWATALARAGTS